MEIFLESLMMTKIRYCLDVLKFLGNSILETGSFTKSFGPPTKKVSAGSFVMSI